MVWDPVWNLEMVGIRREALLFVVTADGMGPNASKEFR